MPSLSDLRNNVPPAWRYARSWLVDLADELISIQGGTPTSSFTTFSGQVAAPSNPAAGSYRLYFTNTGLLRSVDSGGTIREYMDLSSVQTATGLKTFTTTLTVTGNAPSLILTGSINTAKTVRFQVSGANRWQLASNNSTESGSDAGSNFVITRFDDAGNTIDSPLQITRSTGSFSLLTPNFVLSHATGTLLDVSSSTATPTNRQLRFRTGNLTRWTISVGSTAESGGDAGSDFALFRHNDGGAISGTTISVARSIGQISLTNNVIITRTTATTAASEAPLILRVGSTGTPSSGYGIRVPFQVHTNNNTMRDMFDLLAIWVDATDATRTSRSHFRGFDSNGVREFMRGETNGSAPLISFYGQAPAVARQTVTGSRGGNAALASLLTALANLGLITDSTTA